MTVKGKGGTPKIWTGEKAKWVQDEVCRRLVAGETLTNICKDPKMPTEQVIYAWLLDGNNDKFCKDYARARYIRCEKMAEDIENIANTPAIEFSTPTDPTGVQHRKLQIDTRKWLLAKMQPARYGDKVEIDHSGTVKIDAITRKVVDPIQGTIIDQKFTEQAIKAITNDSKEDENGQSDS